MNMLLWLAISAAVRVHAKRASDTVADDDAFWTQSLDCPRRSVVTAHFLTPDGSNAADVLGSTTGAFLTILAEHLERTPCIFARLANTVTPFRFKRFVIVVDSAEKTAAGTARARGAWTPSIGTGSTRPAISRTRCASRCWTTVRLRTR